MFVRWLLLFCFSAVLLLGWKKLIMERSRHQLLVRHVEIVIIFLIWTHLVISTTALWNQASSVVLPVHRGCTKLPPTLHTWTSSCSNTVRWIGIGTDRQLLDALLLSCHLSCIRTALMMFTQLQTVSVVGNVVIDHVTGIGQLIGNCHCHLLSAR